MTEKQKKFADEYLIDLNGTRAYMAVYKNVTKKAAGNGASRLLKKSDIRNYIDNELEKIQRICCGDCDRGDLRVCA